MAFTAEHYLFTWGGTLRTAEAWTMGLRCTGFLLENGTQEEEEEQLEAMALALGTWWGTGISGSGARLTWAKFNRIGLDGKYLKGYTNLYEYATAISPTGTSPYPNQVSLVVTLETGLARGLAHRGRLFFPIPKAPVVEADGLLAAAGADSLAASAAGLIDALNAAGQGTVIKVASSVREGAERTVTGVSVGRVLDTMRSRRAQLVEGRSTAAVAAVP